jgi:hypothetical protein
MGAIQRGKAMRGYALKNLRAKDQIECLGRGQNARWRKCRMKWVTNWVMSRPRKGVDLCDRFATQLATPPFGRVNEKMEL